MEEEHTPVTPRNQPRIPDAVAAQLLQTPEPHTAQQYRIVTPSSAWGTASLTASPYQSDETGILVIPSTLSDANDWVVGQTGFGSETAAGDRPVDGSPSVPRV